MFYNTPRLPRALLHILTVIKRTYVRGPGGQSKPVEETVTSFWGVVMPLSNLALEAATGRVVHAELSETLYG